MNNRKRRLISLQGLFLFLGLAAISILTCAQRVSAEEQQKMPYLIKVNRTCNTITIYEKDQDGSYTLPVKAMVCSVGAKGTQTKLGTFQTKEKYRWKLLKGDVWGQYATRIVGGILFHSVYYYGSCNPATLATKEYNKLGTAASHGCVRLTVEDAKWIYDNCSTGTTVIIYDDADNPGPLGKPDTIKISSTVRWDPTDPNVNNPYNETIPVITGAKNLVIEYGVSVNLLDGVKAKSSLGANITSDMIIDGTVDVNKSGEYKITYSVTDEQGRQVTKTIKVTVKECTVAPEIVGVSDRLVNGETTIDKKFALTGVEAYQGDQKLDKKLIKVTIEQKSDDDYDITYQITVDKKTATQQASVHVDREAPVITGMKDYYLEAGEIPDTSELMSEISVSDNYSKTENIDVTVDVSDNPEGGFVITYTATDESGNQTKETARIYN
ncbi:MAG TPA: L,D-transpeptidase family protein [Mobilitalea sp.]|nr:L,D-transpeptidase family protein [Mobilitalea sp.]